MRPGTRIILTDHCRRAMAKRSVTEEEIRRAIAQGQWEEGKEGRKRAEVVIPYEAKWRGKYYSHKRVRVVFEDRVWAVVVVTVIALYF